MRILKATPFSPGDMSAKEVINKRGLVVVIECSDVERMNLIAKLKPMYGGDSGEFIEIEEEVDPVLDEDELGLLRFCVGDNVRYVGNNYTELRGIPGRVTDFVRVTCSFQYEVRFQNVPRTKPPSYRRCAANELVLDEVTLDENVIFEPLPVANAAPRNARRK